MIGVDENGIGLNMLECRNETGQEIKKISGNGLVEPALPKDAGVSEF